MGLDQFTCELILGKEKIPVSISRDQQEAVYNWDVKRHCNADWELHLILEGQCNVDLEDKHTLLKAGQLLLIAPGQYHRPKALPGAFKRFTATFVLPRGQLRHQLCSLVPDGAVVNAEAALCRLAEAIIRESREQSAFHTQCKTAMLTQFFIEAFRLLHLKEESVSNVAKAASSELTQQIDSFFEQHFADSCGEQALAKILHVSRRHLIRLLQENYGMTYRQKLIHTRMDYAAWLLRTTDTQISQISNTVGYSSEAAFFRVFRQHFGMTPRQYRQQKKNL